MKTLSLSTLATQLVPLPEWEAQFNNLTHRLSRRFARPDARKQASEYLQGLLSPVERKNSWQLAEQLGHATPYRVQHLLDRAVWDADAVRDDLQAYVSEQLGHPDGVLVIDETGFLKKGEHSVGVKRQYSGTAGRVENSQVGVFVGYASPQGQTLLDRALYLPQEWADDPARRRKAKVPDAVKFATKPQLAQTMLSRALDAGIAAAWVTGDSVYGNDRPLQAMLQVRRQAYVLAVKSDLRLPFLGGGIRAQTLANRVPASDWQTLSCGNGAKGARLYEWARVPLDVPEQADFASWLLVRRSLSNPSEQAYYQVFAPQDTPLTSLVTVAGTRWTVETNFETAKGEVGLDHYEVRSWHGWHRHMTLCLLAQAFLAVLRSVSVEAQLKGGKTMPRNSLRRFKQSRGLSCP